VSRQRLAERRFLVAAVLLIVKRDRPKPLPRECPLCHVELRPDQRLREHLLADHDKQELARFVEAELEFER